MGVTRVAAAERRELVARLMAEREVSGETWRSIAERTGINYATLTGVSSGNSGGRSSGKSDAWEECGEGRSAVKRGGCEGDEVPLVKTGLRRRVDAGAALPSGA